MPFREPTDAEPLDHSEESLFPRYGLASNPSLLQALRQGGEGKALETATGIGARNRAMFLRRLPRLALTPTVPREEEPEPADETASEEALSWIQIRLLDETGSPMAGAKYRIEPPSGGPIDGALDDSGEARHEGLKPGACKVSFPELERQPLPPAPA